MRQLWQWEFWPFWFFYLPVYGYWLWLSLRAGSPFFFSAANPLMKLGGFMEYSKYKVLAHIPEAYRPPMQLLEPPFSEAEVTLSFPLIAKPDKGERGRAVRKINDAEALQAYLRTAKEAVILQEFVDLPLEFGLMYHRMPNSPKGKITSLMQREFLHVTGDGIASIRELLLASSRNQRYAEKVVTAYPELSDSVPEKGERVLVEPIGNHSRGTIFRNKNHRITAELEAVFDRISAPVSGYFFGRYDLRAASWEALFAGEVQILELNGANSEPAHIYDPDMQLLQAYRDLFRHWKTLYRVSRANHQRGIAYTSWKEVLRLAQARWG